MDHRRRRGGREQSWDLGHWRSLTAGASGKPASLRVPVWFGCRCHHLFRRFPVMVLFIIFCPIVAAILIMVGAPARKTALAASVLIFAGALFLFASFGYCQRDFQNFTSFSISTYWHMSFLMGIACC